MIAQIEREAAQVGRLTDQIKAQTVAEQDRKRVQDEAQRAAERRQDALADIAFERQQATRSPEEQRIAAPLRAAGIEWKRQAA